jgi:hypothetical protein
MSYNEKYAKHVLALDKFMVVLRYGFKISAEVFWWSSTQTLVNKHSGSKGDI